MSFGATMGAKVEVRAEQVAKPNRNIDDAYTAM